MNENIIVKKSKIEGKSVFALKDFKKGETVIKWKNYKFLSREEAYALPEKERHYVNFFEGKYLLLHHPERYVNHSCDANTFCDNFSDIARRNIKEGEEITANYSEESIVNLKNMECKCGSSNCRELISSKKDE